MNTLQTKVTNETVDTLLKRNHKNNDIFFERYKHNHFPHVLLSDYSFGGTPEQFNMLWEENKKYLVPLKTERREEITEDNYGKFLGKPEYYAEYLEFFTREIKKYGRDQAFLLYYQKPDIILHAFGGVLHPLIHLGFAAEFQRDDIMAEGLALMCVQDLLVGDSLSFLYSPVVPEKQWTELLPFFDMIRNDKEITQLLPGTTPNKLRTTFEELQDKVSYYAGLWRFDKSDDASILKYLKITYETAIYMYCATVFNPMYMKETNWSKVSERVKPDFFLLHGLTSALSLLELVPLMENTLALKTIRGHFAMLILFFISRGRPQFNFYAIENYPIPKEIRGWEGIVDWTKKSTDLHVAKVIRSLMIGERFIEEGVIPSSGLITREFLLSLKKESLIWRAAVMTIDWLEIKNEDWEMNGCGFKETWESMKKEEFLEKEYWEITSHSLKQKKEEKAALRRKEEREREGIRGMDKPKTPVDT